MSIGDLSKVDPPLARDFLGEALEALFGNRRIKSIDDFSDRVKATILDISQEIGLDVDNLNAKKIAFLEIAIAEKIEQIAIGQIIKSKTRYKTGGMGIINPSLYKIEIDTYAKDRILNHGLSIKDIDKSIKKPASHQHIRKPRNFPSQTPEVSLFVGILESEKKSRRPVSVDWCLVVAQRLGDRLRVENAWRLWGDEYNTIGFESSPLDLLQSFCNKYGASISIANNAPKKLIKDFITEESKFHINVVVDSPSEVAPLTYFGAWTSEYPPVGVMSLVFSIQEIAYWRSLLSKGLRVPMPSPATATISPTNAGRIYSDSEFLTTERHFIYHGSDT